MPTNPLWLEHTEKAAWDTVNTLREEIVRANQRLEQIVALKPEWPAMLQRLEQARLEFALSSDTPSAQLDELLALLRNRPTAATSSSDGPSIPLTRPTDAPGPPRIGNESSADDFAEGSARDKLQERASPSVRWFAQKLDRRRSGLARMKVDPNRRGALIAELEQEVDELRFAKGADLLSAAVRIGNLSLELARIGRRG